MTEIPIACTLSTTVIQLERRCCPFLRFSLTVEPGEAGVELGLTGPPGTREFLAHWVSPPGARTTDR